MTKFRRKYNTVVLYIWGLPDQASICMTNEMLDQNIACFRDVLYQVLTKINRQKYVSEPTDGKEQFVVLKTDGEKLMTNSFSFFTSVDYN